jgi:hypothetical protein
MLHVAKSANAKLLGSGTSSAAIIKFSFLSATAFGEATPDTHSAVRYIARAADAHCAGGPVVN